MNAVNCRHAQERKELTRSNQNGTRGEAADYQRETGTDKRKASRQTTQTFHRQRIDRLDNE
ncbi:MAG: hypothetical protein A2268_11935 [Candidatus Raymondbacteria bacterium RifOxyA12_full_50_37]|uniref:Uncharacterized protein n=1 Tax=Candidatus Raymondbacteria bacterium RIFOXYD12_FULL_49_13 TaxID=1817890 RepID=A0A1F7FGS5_UNCRA|nr:MAG: hypothetical protein A2268_11935 [Candidatus Raymondbacteria bacterium RifOxyA12_full_50_37]OGJ91691.1 MAG: hypothetical protein A2248_08000 [Candidatus Raymondbacteria bacterium RIFOXYA2_FULL_49_16]OGJ98702.1 MAG: hypothetical protein A2453_08165 [Candidatus Raymondbacteria bacterium RIFOXYC2_FULL_50_21]OGK02192.1 MAG: hypothetical protein A2350_20225 [Candidatus Raymondbacteria bacterium RifOxyB12_full_50_8]OGK05801.1 MAG: hypothetical protein A2519_01800 [Candidatus Raymondbacteria b